MHLIQRNIIIVSLSILLILSSICITRDSNAQKTSVVPSVNDNNLEIKTVITGLDKPVSIAFLGPNDMLVVEKNTGIVHRILDGQLVKEPLLDVNVFGKDESGMLGVQTAKNHNGKVYVFLYYTKAEGGDENFDQQKNMGNRLYRYELINNKLVNPKLLLSLPRGSGSHNGGAIKLAPDGNLYIPVGDLAPGVGETHGGTQAQNNQNGSRPNLSGGILRMTQDGRPVGGIIGDSFPESLYFAYGIRNSFGIDFDPVTGTLWDTENGPEFGDEINIVGPGFNSGWIQVQGTWKRDFADRWVMGEQFNESHLVDFDGKGKYSPPEFVWQDTVGPTAIKFLSPKLGSQYENDIFVGDINYGRIYHFELNKNRTGLELNGSLSDRVANNSAELKPVIFGQGFNGISDIEVGPDGYLYVVSFSYVCNPSIDHVKPQGTIYKISPKTANSKVSNDESLLENDARKSKIIGNIASNAFIKNIFVPTKTDNGSILLLENQTHWSAPLRLNATYIEGSFRLFDDKNQTTKDRHAGLVWQEGNNKTYYAFIRPGELILSDTVGEIECALLFGAREGNWNKITILNSVDSLYIYYNDTLRIKVPREFRGTDISLVGIRSHNTNAEFDPIKVGNLPQIIFQYLSREDAVKVNKNDTISITTYGNSIR